jgi:hypothetical protein
MIGELQRATSSSNGIIGALQGPVSPELLLFAPQHDNSGGEEDANSNSDGTWDWELVSHLLKAYQQVIIALEVFDRSILEATRSFGAFLGWFRFNISKFLQPVNKLKFVGS